FDLECSAGSNQLTQSNIGHAVVDQVIDDADGYATDLRAVLGGAGSSELGRRWGGGNVDDALYGEGFKADIQAVCEIDVRRGGTVNQRVGAVDGIHCGFEQLVAGADFVFAGQGQIVQANPNFVVRGN